jgi:hypothetical protein
MKNISWLCASTLILLQFTTSCTSQKIAMQSVPVSSTPLGAEVHANGRYIGQTPLCIDLEKNRHHQITISKPGYVTENVTVMAEKDEKKIYARAFTEGLDSGLLFKDPSFAISSAHNSMTTDEETGDCNNLEPACIALQLVPENK